MNYARLLPPWKIRSHLSIYLRTGSEDVCTGAGGCMSVSSAGGANALGSSSFSSLVCFSAREECETFLEFFFIMRRSVVYLQQPSSLVPLSRESFIILWCATVTLCHFQTRTLPSCRCTPSPGSIIHLLVSSCGLEINKLNIHDFLRLFFSRA